MAFSRDGGTLLACSRDGTGYVIPTRGGGRVLEYPLLGEVRAAERNMFSAAVDSLGRTLMFGGENGALVCNDSGAGVTDGPLQLAGNLRVKCDNAGFLLISSRTPGSLSSALTPIANLRLRADENGYLVVCH